MSKIFKKNKQILQPYSEIIDLSAELKEYKNLCNGEKANYTYTKWKNDMLCKIEKLDSEEKIINFIHYLINKKRILSNMNSSFLPLMICFISILFNSIGLLLPEGAEYNIIRFLVIIISLFWCIISLVKDHKNNGIEYCFYCDLIEIVEEKISDKN